MKKRIIVFIVVLTVTMGSYWAGFSANKDRDDFLKELDIFAEGLAVIEKKYVEDKKPQDLIYGAMRGVMSSLDAYSQFMTPEDYKELLVETGGKFGGLGIEITIKEGLLTIVSPIEDTPAWNAGLEAADVIVKIEGELTKDITLQEAVKKLRGDPGTEVTITVLRNADRKLEDVTIVRGIIKIKDIKRPMILDEGIGYVRIAEFRESTDKDLAVALEKLKNQGLRGLVVDVRYNPGGLLDSAVKVSSLFLKDNEVIVSIDSKNEEKKVYRSIPLNGKIVDVPIVVLINQGSASASEILAAALRDNNKAILLGQTTFGKGSVQTIIPLSDGSALRLTTSKYYTPKEISIHEKGIKPDIVVEPRDLSEVKEDLFKKIEKEEKAAKLEKGKEQVDGENQEEDEFDYRKDYQIVRAVDLIKGLLVLEKNK
ncbi:MAG: S41 family peptidase [Candidatus Omnitrophica bacterium]|nr:S41 family peptidase [Candidatus Omnitrophota bacterium]